MDKAQIRRSDLNELIRDYFVVKGLSDVAETFEKEACIPERKDTTLLAHRSRLTTALAKGDVTEAIQLLQQLDSQLLSANPHLMYYVEKQGLLELIRQGNTVEALQFAQTRVAPLAKQNEEFLTEIETIMALLLFPDASKSPDSHLLDDAQRQKTALDLNSALLRAVNHNDQPLLHTLLKMILWAEAQCKANNIDILPTVDWDQASVEDKSHSDQTQDKSCK